MQLTTPAPGRQITSPFGWRRHPVTGKRSHHGGIDIGGTFPVVAAGDGKVVSNAFDAGGLGYYVGIQHTSRLRTYYGHGKARSKVVVGQDIRDDDEIYISGSTGLSTGPHLHFEVRVRNWLGIWVRVNPAPYLTAAPKPKPTPRVQEDDEMKPIVFKRTEGGPEWSLIAPWLTGATSLEQGYRATTDPAVGLAWERMYADGSGTANNVNRAGYIAAQTEARANRAAWVADKSLGLS